MRQFFLGGVLLCVVTVSALIAGAEKEAYFANAPRDSEGRFTNIVGDISHGSLAVRLPFILRRLGTYFRSADGAPDKVANDGSFLRENSLENVSRSVPTVTWIGHATLLVQIEDVTFLTDPTWSNTPSPVPLIGPSRFVEPGLLIEDLPAVDFVVISHNHFDHLDLPTLKLLAARDSNTLFYVPLGNGNLLQKAGIENVKELDWGQTAAYKGLTVHCLPSQHWSKRSLTDTRRALWSSWAVISAERRFYFAGDTGYFSGFADIGQQLGPFDLAAVPIGAYEPNEMMHSSHMNPEEALQAAIELRARRAVAIHFGTFDLSDEPLNEPPLRFKTAAQQSELDESSAWVLNIGETRKF
jgi:N-acyl-phosphatidylethanolamine-hydrolysing phospholipase D